MSEYNVATNPEFADDHFKVLRKDFSTIQKKLATIIPPADRDVFTEPLDDSPGK